MSKRQEDADRALAPLPMTSPPTRRYRAAAFQAYVLIACVIFVVLALLAHSTAYFPIDLFVTRSIQAHRDPMFARLMYWVSWPGYPPHAYILGISVVVALFIARLRWEAVVTLFAESSWSLVVAMKLIVHRPRPSIDLVEVLNKLSDSSFPSGHVVQYTAFMGFLLFLVYSLLKSSPLRTMLMVLLALLIALVGPSRIYLGEHWFTDVIGAYLFGSLWLALTIKVYRWGKGRFFKSRAPGERS